MVLRRSDMEMSTLKVKSDGLIRGSAGVSIEITGDRLEGVRTGYNSGEELKSHSGFEPIE